MECVVVRVVGGTLEMCATGVGVMLAFGASRANWEAQSVQRSDAEVKINEVKTRVGGGVFKASAIAISAAGKEPAAIT